MKKQVFYRNAHLGEVWNDVGAAVASVLNVNLYQLVAEIEDDDVFRAMNVVTGDELPARRGLRSMCVGDVYLCGEEAFFCLPAGWCQLPPEKAAEFRSAAALSVLGGMEVEVGW